MSSQVSPRVDPAGGVVQATKQPGDGRQRDVGLAPVRIGRHGDLAVDEHEALASVFVNADRSRCALEPGDRHRPQEGVDRSRVRARWPKNVRPDADHLACVGDSASELLLGHIATLAEQR